MPYRFVTSLLIASSLVMVRSARAEGGTPVSGTMFHELTCVVDDDGKAGKAPVLEGILAAGEGVDVAWAGADVYPNLFVMKKSGVLRPLATAAGGNYLQFPPLMPGERAFVCFDGRFVWVPMAARGREPALYVVDPLDESVYRIGASEGLPLVAADKLPKSVLVENLLLVPIAPGRVVAVVLTDSTTLAEVTFDPKTGGHAKTVFQGHREDPGRDVAGPEGLDFRFTPRPMVPLRSRDGAIQQLLVGRSTNRGTVSPLILDVGDWSATPMAASAPLHRPLSIFTDCQPLVDGDSFYWLDMLPQNGGRLTLMHATLPELKPETVAEDLPLGHLVREGDRIHCVGMGWATCSAPPAPALGAVQRAKTVSSVVPWKYQSPQGGSGNVAPGDPVFKGAWFSQHLGVLVTARTNDGRKVAFKLGDPPRIAEVEKGSNSQSKTRPPASESPFSESDGAEADRSSETSTTTQEPAGHAAAETPEFDWAVPEGSVASVVRFYRTGDGRDARPLALLERPHQPAKFADNDRLPPLAHELARQSLLIAAREAAGCLTRDAALGEAFPAAAEPPLAQLAIVTHFTERGEPNFRVVRIDAAGRARFVWEQSLALVEQETRRLDYGRYAESAERWSRDDFSRLLGEAGLAIKENRGNAGSASERAERSLAEMNFVSQFAALRELHRENRQNGESAERLAALARGYANLGLLSECHWSGANRALKARGLLYGQRLVATRRDSPAGLWNRAYVKALLGFQQSALDDIAAAAAFKPNGPPEAPPDWLPLVEAFCAFDEAALRRAEETTQRPQLAALLELLRHPRSDMSAVAIKRVLAAIKAVPDCLYLYDRLAAICDLATGRVATELAPSVLAKMLSARLPKLIDVPPLAKKIADEAEPDDSMPTKLASTFKEAGRFSDQDEISWSMLGAMIDEIVFDQIWRRADFMKHKWAVPVEGYLSSKKPVFGLHPFRAVMALYAGDRDLQSWLKDLSDRGQPEGLNWERATAIRRLLEGVPRDRQPQGLDMVFRTDCYEDDVYDDLLGKHLYLGVDDGNRQAKRTALSPHHPETIARLAHHKDLAREYGREWEKRYAGEPLVLGALAKAYDRLKLDADAERVLRELIRLSPDFSAYRQLTKRLKDRDEMEKWKATWDEYLALPSQGLQHAHAQVEVANYLMKQNRYAEALPYASEAAESWAQWAMVCAVRCYLGLGDEKQEGLWRARLAERYPSLKNFGDYYLWACRTGQPKTDSIWKSIGKQIEAALEKRSPDERFFLGGIYLLNESPRQAFDIFNEAFNSLKESDDKCIDGLLAAVVADELHQKVSRRKALEAVARVSSKEQKAYSALAKALGEAFAENEQSPLNAGSAGELVDAAPVDKRPTVSYLVGYVLDKHGQTDAALPFYEAAARQSNREAMICVLASHRLHKLRKQKSD